MREEDGKGAGRPGLRQYEHAYDIDGEFEPTSRDQRRVMLSAAGAISPRLWRGGAGAAVGGEWAPEQADDIYSFGIVMYEVLAGYLAFPKMSPHSIQDVMEQFDRPSQRPQVDIGVLLSTGCPSEVTDLVEECLCFQPERRPCAKDILRRLQGLHWFFRA